MKKFDLKKHLIENKLTENSKLLKEENSFEPAGNQKRVEDQDLKEEEDAELEAAKEKAKRISREEGVAQHVNKRPNGSYKVEDWFDSEQTVASYENGNMM